MPQTRVRVGGSGFTTFSYRGQVLAFARIVGDTGQTPLVPPVAIQPLDARHPIEIATPRAVGIGALTLSLYELWNAPVWQQLRGLEGTSDVIAVYEAMAADPAAITCQMLIKPPGANYYRGKNYLGCVVTSIDDTENITIGALDVAKTMTISYTHTTPVVINAPR